MRDPQTPTENDSSGLKRRMTRAFLLSLFSTASLSALAFAPSGIDPFRTKSAPKSPFKNWGLINFQSDSPRERSHIQAVDAWKIAEGSRDVVVAVIDTGVDPTHKSLKDNMWRSRRHFPTDGQAVYGWNFVTNLPNPKDDHGHGTHVAGIIGAMADPETGVSGVAHQVSIMAVKYYSESNPGSVNLKNTVKAIEFAVENGAKIINYSGGGPEFSEDEYIAIKKAEARGVLFVAAAGNEKQDTDRVENYYYPSAYRLSNILSVAATDIHNKLLRSSNWGKARVDVTAPGENIFSTLPGGRYGYMSGTSQATAFVSGVAALLLSKDPSLTPVDLKKIILASVDKIPHLSEKVATGGRVNAYTALLNLKDYRRNPNPGQPKSAPEVLATRPRSSFLQLITTPSTVE